LLSFNPHKLKVSPSLDPDLLEQSGFRAGEFRERKIPQFLELGDTRATHAWMENFKDCKNLTKGFFRRAKDDLPSFPRPAGRAWERG
jgi:hypothetical protein